MMRADLKERISPTVVDNSQNFSAAAVDDPDQAKDGTGAPDRTDFRTVLTNSNEEVKKKREAKKRGDFSESKSEKDFLKDLADQSKPKREIHNSLNKDDFLKLFVEQLKHQDPMNPDDGAEMASKLAQFNSLEQMLNVNTTLNKMLDSQNSDRSMQMVNYVGKEISLDGGRVRMMDGKAASPAEFAFEAPAQKVSVQIRDGAGITVREMEMGSLPGGTHAVNWDGLDKKGGRVADGIYNYFVSAKNANGVDIPVKLTTKAKITGVDVKDKAGAIYTDFGRVKMDEIGSVGVNGFQDAKKEGIATPSARTQADGQGGASGGGQGKTPSTAEELERMRAAGQLQLPAAREPSAARESPNPLPTSPANPASGALAATPADSQGENPMGGEMSREPHDAMAPVPEPRGNAPRDMTGRIDTNAPGNDASKNPVTTKVDEAATAASLSDKKAQREHNGRTKTA